MTKDVEKKIEELEKEVDKNRDTESYLSQLNQRILDSNGFLTKEGGYLCKAEWHAVMIGISFPAMAFMLPTPLGEFMIVAMLLMLRTGFKKLGKDLDGHMADVMHELAYMLVSAMLTIGCFTYLSGRRLKEIDVGQAILSMLVGG